MIEVTLKNYRCFPDSRPVTFQVQRGLTAFVGKNNAGKSSLLKFFYEFRHLFGELSTNQNAFVHSLNRRKQSFSLMPEIKDVRELFHNGNDRDLEIQVSIDNNSPSGTAPAPLRCDIVVYRGTNTFTSKLVMDEGPLDAARGEIGLHPNAASVLMQSGIVIAELGSLVKTFDTLRQTLYIGPFRNAINIGSNTNYFDIQVGQAFISRWKYFKSGPQVSLNEASYRVEKEIQEIFELSDLQINVGPDDQLLQLFMNGRSFRLSEVGAGIAQFIVVLANVAMANPRYILLDEPELGLHPSLQIDFLTALASYAPLGGVLFASHSIGLARAAAQWVLAVRKESQFESSVRPLEAMPRLSEFLGELSFGGYREIGFDKVVLVEGPTDVLAVQQLLRLYEKDHSVMLLHMGGNTLINGSQATEIQLQELKRITENISAIVDSEKNGPGDPLPADREAFRKVCQHVGINCKILDRRAIENYWSEQAVQSVKGKGTAALQFFEKLKDAPTAWSKIDNWLIARAMQKADLSQTDLGQFIEAL